ncbi:hypothetical protein H4R33_005193 [Dimargaris cristalligena]|uniref:Transmembrane protein n=1 Tax=Dimargaris cristalligena TaxID=215637 RepID=A0A4P9ZVR1_9FUNG|nr:hypothetical protein H4R33_005193 [Dimargaris cristalligena]RKP36730.1 hypothetical protein BJ085DRAFT_33579 [Dimargaris cristalligena]|eukprot:RKP36730.1 hypothetical protein BJ085DRAFT_33579 [Dimargaris cristalligena]
MKLLETLSAQTPSGKVKRIFATAFLVGAGCLVYLCATWSVNPELQPDLLSFHKHQDKYEAIRRKIRERYMARLRERTWADESSQSEENPLLHHYHRHHQRSLSSELSDGFSEAAVRGFLEDSFYDHEDDLSADRFHGAASDSSSLARVQSVLMEGSSDAQTTFNGLQQEHATRKQLIHRLDALLLEQRSPIYARSNEWLSRNLLRLHQQV